MCLWYYVLNGPSAEFWVTQTKPISHLKLNVWPYSTILLRCPPADLTKMRRRAFYLCPSLILVINHVRVTNKFETMCSTHVISYDWEYLNDPYSLIDVIKWNLHYTVCTCNINVIMQDRCLHPKYLCWHASNKYPRASDIIILKFIYCQYLTSNMRDATSLCWHATYLQVCRQKIKIFSIQVNYINMEDI